MLQNIRDKSQGFLAWFVVLVIISTFALWGIHSYVTSSQNTNIAAYVNRQPITQTDVNDVYERLRQQQQIQLGAAYSLSSSAEASLKQQALQQLIVSNVLLRAAVDAGFRITTNQVDEALVNLPAFQVNGQFSIDRFHEMLGGLSQDQFLADLRNQMLMAQVQGGYVNSAFALPNEIMTSIKLVNQKRDINYIVLPATHFISQAQVSPDEVKQYYQSHQNDFQSPEQVSVEYLQLSLADIKSSLHFDAAKLQQYYENNLQNYTQPASWHVAHILVKVSPDASPAEVASAQDKINSIAAQLKSGADFAALAKLDSDDKTSAQHGGELSWFSAGTLDPAFEKAVTNLQNVGDVSQPVRTSYGFSIIKLLGVNKSQVLPFDQVKDQVQNALAEQQAEQIFADDSDKLSNLTYANPDSLNVAATTLGLPIKTTDLFTHQGTKQGITANPHVVAAAFSSDVLSQGNNSDLIEIDPTTEIVLRVKNHTPAAVLPFTAVQNTIQTALLNKKADQLAQQQGQGLIPQLQNNKITLQQVAQQYHLAIQTVNNAGRFDPRVNAAILTEAFRMPRPSSAVPTVSGFALPSGDYALIELNAIHDGDASANNAVVSRIFREQLENNLGQIDYELYERQQLNNAKITIPKNSSILSSTSTTTG